MSDASAAQALYPDLPSAADPPAARGPSSTTSPAAQALYGDGQKVARPVDGKSPLGGAAQPASLLGEEPSPRPGDRPDPAGQRTGPDAAPFNPDRLDLPEGTVNTAALDQFTEIAKASGLKQGAAQRLVELHNRAVSEAHDHVVGSWANDARRELGPELPGMVGAIKGTLDIAPEVARLLDWSGLGNHPAVIRQFHAWAQELSRARRGRY